MRHKKIYQDIITEVSKNIAQKMIKEEHDLAQRATTIDKDIQDIVQEIGRQTTQNVLEETRDRLVLKKKATGMTIHKNPTIQFTVIFGTIEINSPYLWPGSPPAKPLLEEMHITHHGRSETVKRALSDFGIDDSFQAARQKFTEHYHVDIGISTVARTTKQIARDAVDYMAEKLASVPSALGEKRGSGQEALLVELDGCEVRTAHMHVIDDPEQPSPVYHKPKKAKSIAWRELRLGFARPLQQPEKVFVGKMDSYPEVVGQLHQAAEFIGMTSETKVIGVADGGIGLSEELGRQFPTMQFILDKSHLRDHLYDTAEKMGVAKAERATWVEPRLQEISDGHVGTILEEFVRENEQHPCDRLQRLIGYLTRFSEAVAYTRFQEHEYPIGSGEIESAHKSVPQKRLKLPGATWHPDSIDPMLALRIVRTNEWWEDFWEYRTEKLLVA